MNKRRSFGSIKAVELNTCINYGE